MKYKTKIQTLLEMGIYCHCMQRLSVYVWSLDHTLGLTKRLLFILQSAVYVRRHVLHMYQKNNMATSWQQRKRSFFLLLYLAEQHENVKTENDVYDCLAKIGLRRGHEISTQFTFLVNAQSACLWLQILGSVRTWADDKMYVKRTLAATETMNRP